MSPSRLLCMFRITVSLAALASLVLHAGCATPATETLGQRVARAKPGETVLLPPGVFEGGVTLPAGVSLKGAGWAQTIIDASSCDYGLLLTGAQASQVSDLTVRGAREANIRIESAQDPAVRRVRATGARFGLTCKDATRTRIENMIVDGNQYGLLLAGGKGCSVVNCTIARNAMMGVSIPSGQSTVLFNNLIADDETGVYVGARNLDLTIDRNVYACPLTGRLEGQTSRGKLGSWQALTGQDRHSVQMPVSFRNGDAADYHPTNVLAWALDRAATSDWGVPKLEKVPAPETDIDGRPRSGAPDCGAYETVVDPPRPPDIHIELQTTAPAKSAGWFTKDGREIAYLFQNLPLPKGHYAIWLPSRDFAGEPIIADDYYQIRVVEADLQWDYLGWIGDNGEAGPASRTAPLQCEAVAFGPEGQLAVGQGSSADGTNVRCYDSLRGKLRWTFAGACDMRGLAFADDGALYVLRFDARGSKALVLSRLDGRTGKPIPWKSGKLGQNDLKLKTGQGLAALGGRLYLADTEGDAVRFGSAEEGVLDGSISVEKPSSPCADAKAGLLWVISAGKDVVAIDKDGAVQARVSPVDEPMALAARDNVLAIASRATGKVHIFDAEAIKHPRAKRTLGKGDGPFGPWAPDRFLFQAAPGSRVTPTLAIHGTGDVAVAESNRLLVFDGQGKCRWFTFGTAGDPTPSHPNPRRVYDGNAWVSYVLDEPNGTWAPEGYWQAPTSAVLGTATNVTFYGDFAVGDKVFGVSSAEIPGQGPSLVLMRFEGYRQKLVSLFWYDAAQKAIVQRRDTNKDGELDGQDEAMPLIDDKAQPLNMEFDFRFAEVLPSGDIFSHAPDGGGSYAYFWRFSGLDRDEVPHYQVDTRRFAREREGLPSPYSHKRDKSASFCDGALDLMDGQAVVGVRSSASLSNTGAAGNVPQDVAAYDAQGQLRWFLPLPEFNGFYLSETVKGFTVAAAYATHDFAIFNKDGLVVGVHGPDAAARHVPYWLNHAEAIRASAGATGNIQLFTADALSGRTHWWRIAGSEKIRSHFDWLKIPKEKALALASLPEPAPLTVPRPAPRTIRIPRLAAPLPIDGDIQKWRAAGVAPQLILSPDSATGPVQGPADASALVRLAYEGTNLYVQVLQFDDAVCFDGSERGRQDCFELCVNGACAGFRFDVTQTRGDPPFVRRQRLGADLSATLDARHAPCTIRVLDNATDVAERKVFEAVYGVDMSKCKVIVYEFKLPMDEVTYAGAVKDLVPLKPGATFWLGVAIDDADVPAADDAVQLVAPATCTCVLAKEYGVEATLE